MSSDTNPCFCHLRSSCYCGARGHDYDENRLMSFKVTDNHIVAWMTCPRCWKLLNRNEKSAEKHARKAEREANKYVLSLAGFMEI